MKTNIRKTLDVFFLLSYFAVLVNTSKFLTEVSYENLLTVLFTAAVWLFYSAAYLFPAYAISHVVCFFVMRKSDDLATGKSKIKSAVVYSLAVIPGIT